MSKAPHSIMKIKRAITKACQDDDVTAMVQIVDATKQSELTAMRQELLDFGLERSARINAIEVLSYVLQEGADPDHCGTDLSLFWGDLNLPSHATLEILIAHGWNINSCGHTCANKPLLWLALRDADLVAWCLEYGASTDLPDMGHQGRRPILERAAALGVITIFDMLRDHGAPLSPRILPIAVRSANGYAPKAGESPSTTYEMHLGMVRHLIDVVGIDVNIGSVWPGSTCSTPLCCIACYQKGDATRLVHLLLARGVKPDQAVPSDETLQIPSAIEAATLHENYMFLHTVETWQMQSIEEEILVVECSPSARSPLFV